MHYTKKIGLLSIGSAALCFLPETQAQSLMDFVVTVDMDQNALFNNAGTLDVTLGMPPVTELSGLGVGSGSNVNLNTGEGVLNLSSVLLVANQGAQFSISSPDGPTNLDSRVQTLQTQVANGGVLTVGPNGRLDSTAFSIGVGPGVEINAADGNVDAGRLNISQEFNVGASGSGVLNVTNGAQVIGPAESPFQLTIASRAGQTGTVNVSGEGTALSSRIIVVGGAGEGAFNLSQGASVVAAESFHVGYIRGSSGSLSINGGSLTAQDFYVGAFGEETIDQDQFIFNSGQLTVTGGAVGTFTELIEVPPVDPVDPNNPAAPVFDRVTQLWNLGNGTDAATLTVARNAEANGTFENFNDISVRNNSALNVEQGAGFTANSITVEDGGTFNFQGRSLSLLEQDLVIEQDGFVGRDVTLARSTAESPTTSSFSTGQDLILRGTVEVTNPDTGEVIETLGSRLTVDGGSLSADRIVIEDGGAFAFRDGGLTLNNQAISVGTGGLIETAVTLDQGQILSSGQEVSILSGGHVTLKDTAEGSATQVLRNNGVAGQINTERLVLESGGGLTIDGGVLNARSAVTDTESHLEFINGTVRITSGDQDNRISFGSTASEAPTDSTTSPAQSLTILGEDGSQTVVLGRRDRQNEQINGSFNSFSTRSSIVLSGLTSGAVIRDGAELRLSGGSLTTSSLSLEGSGTLTVDATQNSSIFLSNGDVSAETAAVDLNIDTSSTAFAFGSQLAQGLSLSVSGGVNVLNDSSFTVASNSTLILGQQSLLAQQTNPGSVLGQITIEDGSNLTLNGGRLIGVEQIQQFGTGTFEWITGELVIDGNLNLNTFGIAEVRDASAQTRQLTINDEQTLTVTRTLSGNGSLLTINEGGFASVLAVIGQVEIVTPGSPVGIIDPLRFNIRRQEFTANTFTTQTTDLIAEQIAINGSLELDPLFRSLANIEIEVGGELGGIGAITGDLVNAGTLAPGASPGTISVVGDFTQTAGGTYLAEIGLAEDSTDFTSDLLQITSLDDGTGGEANLDGLLRLVTLDGFEGMLGDEFLILSAEGGITGGFAGFDTSDADLFDPENTQFATFLDSESGDLFVRVTTLAQPEQFVLLSDDDIQQSIVDLSTIPEPTTSAFFGLGTLALARRRRRPLRENASRIFH